MIVGKPTGSGETPHEWFAWRPVQLVSGHWAWLERLWTAEIWPILSTPWGPINVYGITKSQVEAVQQHAYAGGMCAPRRHSALDFGGTNE